MKVIMSLLSAIYDLGSVLGIFLFIVVAVGAIALLAEHDWNPP
jgi:hypothetical protein